MSPKEQYWTEETQGKTMKIHEEIYDGHLIRANEKAAMVFLDGSKTLETKFTAMSLEDALTKSKAWVDEHDPETDQLQMHEEVAEALGRLGIS